MRLNEPPRINATRRPSFHSITALDRSMRLLDRATSVPKLDGEFDRNCRRLAIQAAGFELAGGYEGPG